MILYHLFLAAKSLRRDLMMSVVMFVALTIGASVWMLAVLQYLRFQGYAVHLSPSLYQVEELRARDANAVFADGARENAYLEPTSLLTRTQLSFPIFRRLSSSTVPARQSAGIRAEVIVRGADAPADVRVARFTDAAFFPMFERAFAAGRPWSDAEAQGSAVERDGPGVVVLGRATGQSLFPRGDAVGKIVHIDGRPFRVTGVLRSYQPLNAPWQLLIIGGNEDALFLPMAELDRLAARPEQPIYQAPVGPERADLFASDTRFVTFWVDLPTPEHRARYLRDLDERLGPGRYTLRSLAEWRRAFAMPTSQIAFFSFLGLVVLLGGGFMAARWLLTKGLSRSAELGIYRALGAPRSSLFWRVIGEAALLSLPAALLAPIVTLPTVWYFNQYVRVVDMPLELSPASLVIGVGIAAASGLVSSLYPAWRLSRSPPTIRLGRL